MPDEASGPPPASESLPYARQSPPPQQGGPFTPELQQQGSPDPRQQQGSPNPRQPPLHASPLGKMPSDPGVLGGRGADAYKDAFASRDGGGRGYSYGGDRRRDSAYPAHSESSAASQLLSSFARVALESGLREQGGRRDWSSSAGDRERGERGARSGGGGMGGGGMGGGGMGGGGMGGGGMGGGGAQGGFRPAQSASWVRERLLGGSSNAAAAAHADMHGAAEYYNGRVGGAHLPPRGDAEAAEARRLAELMARRRVAAGLTLTLSLSLTLSPSPKPKPFT